ncbi:myb family transcription factor PHL8-like isoform X2 [Impatiens glandulifera]|uniref:myb family transcription factor PHL8-like isoform X2 n=1 Tax=Impatiens glandulifera TaxID=253017 RepID=UPI001FB12FFF|nr:myb family transcription factor PHL8-like isoform X2 [Impatiens glandulifera]
MRLVLSSDAKPRLKWTPELHRQFIEAVSLLGGPEKATPKSLMRVMAVPGLTLFHLKSHLQKYRLGTRKKGCQSSNTHHEENDSESIPIFSVADDDDDDEKDRVVDKSWKIAHALKIQMEVQQKLHEQIEVQRHLQLRIEAQGRYLQSVLKKAQETISDYNTSAIGVELAKEELSQLVSIIGIGDSSSSLESSLTSTECHDYDQDDENVKRNDGRPVELPLMDMGSNDCSYGEQQSEKKFDLNSTNQADSEY